MGREDSRCSGSRTAFESLELSGTCQSRTHRDSRNGPPAPVFTRSEPFVSEHHHHSEPFRYSKPLDYLARSRRRVGSRSPKKSANSLQPPAQANSRFIDCSAPVSLDGAVRWHLCALHQAHQSRACI